MITNISVVTTVVLAGVLTLGVDTARAADDERATRCRNLPSHAALRSALAAAQAQPNGGLALYNASGRLVGGIGASGDSSCADHNIAWRTRNALNLDYVPSGVSGDPSRRDNIVYDITPQPGQMPGGSAGGWGHPSCSAAATAIAAALPPTR